ncbi:MAG: acyl-CoA dehydrogenase [Tepidiforma sp.]|jgi:alkylation response protein AidB-like acyl-CoA dehydrogenase|uniref:acyl-CoA dehydrogenase family protein n=1 Tax=Tepidiforma sp. TaxID=2682230 RepID=UPI0021DCFEAB|nr:acyl-CoA dehydrogenase family protein [Tepidiforma sp.]GIW16456.1 MAG: acyl-CoA dehydrogenase [Tepidiforma sp.]
MTTAEHPHAGDRVLTDAEIMELREKVKAFMAEHIYPNEPFFHANHPRQSAAGREKMKELQAITKSLGMWAPHLPAAAGGMGIGFMPYVYMNEILGRSPYAPIAFGSQAPDSGNAEILWQFGSKELQEKYMKPLVAGEIWSCYSMTEPEVSGADPTGLRTTAVRDGDEWVINGHKWFTSQAEGATFAIVMCATELDQPPHRRFTQIVVPTDTPGFEIVRPVPVMGETEGSHCEIRYTNVRVPITNTLGEPGSGFRIAQKRLGPGRIHHCMRWLGQMQRAFELMCEYSLKREVFGSTLSEKQTVQNWIADSYVEIQAARALTLSAAKKIDQGDEARVEISAIKFFGAQILHNVIDRAIQVHGALGVSGDTPLESMYRNARAARIYDGPDEVHRMVVARRILQSFKAGNGWDFGLQ